MVGIEDFTITSRYDESGKRKELLLVTKGSCFLCLSLVSSVTEKLTNFSLRNICRCINILPRSVIVNSENEGEENNEDNDISYERDKCDFSVMLCANCAALSKNLSELIRQKELIEMLMKHELQVYLQIIRESDEEFERNGRQGKNETMGLNCENPGETKIIKNLRKEVKKKCFLKVKRMETNTYPKIQLFPLKRKRLESCLTKSDGVAPKRSKHLKSSKTCSILKRCSTAIKQLVEDVFTRFCKKVDVPEVRRGRGKKFRCILCKYSNAGYCKSTLLKHLANVHTEKFFTHKKLSNLPEEVIKKRCKHILKFESNSQAAKVNSPYERPEARLCSVCNTICCDSHNLKYHLVLDHYNILEERLEQFQDSKLTENSKCRRRKVHKKSGPQGANLFRHRKLVALRNRAKKIGSSRSSVSKRTEAQRSRENDKNMANIPVEDKDIHTVIHDNDDKSRRKPATNFFYSICASHGTKINGGGWKCSLCKVQLKDTTFRIHLVNFHTEIFFASKKPQELSHVALGQLCKDMLISVTNKATQQPNGRDRNILCPYCQQKSSRGYSFRYHLVLRHSDILEQKMKCAKWNNGTVHETVAVNSSGQNNIKSKIARKGKFQRKIKHTKCSAIAGESKNIQREAITKHNKSPESSQINRMMARERKFKQGNEWICPVANGGCGGRYSTFHTLKRHMQKYCPKKRIANGAKEPEENLAIQNHNQHFNISPETLVGLQKENATQHPVTQPPVKSKLKIKRRMAGKGKIERNIKQICSTVVAKSKSFQEDAAPQHHDEPPGSSQINKKLPKKRKLKQGNGWICSVASGGCGRRYSSCYTLNRHIKKYCPKRRVCNDVKESAKIVAAINSYQHCNIPENLVRIQNENAAQHQKSLVNAKIKIKRKIKQKREWICSAANGGCDGRFSSKRNLKRHLQLHCPNNRINKSREEITENLVAVSDNHNHEQDMKRIIIGELTLGDINDSCDVDTSLLHNANPIPVKSEGGSDREDVNNMNRVTEAEEVAINNFNAVISDLKRFV